MPGVRTADHEQPSLLEHVITPVRRLGDDHKLTAAGAFTPADASASSTAEIAS